MNGQDIFSDYSILLKKKSQCSQCLERSGW